MATTYTIKSGDTLSAIAQANKTDIATLQKLNPSITDPNKIYAGASLNIPESQAPVVGAATDGAGNVPISPVITSDQIRLQEQQKKDEQAKKDAEATAEVQRLATQKQISDLKTTLAPSAPAPVQPILEDQYKAMLEEKGSGGLSVNDINNRLLGLQQEKDQAKTQLNAFERVTPEGVSQGYAQGAISKEQQAVQDKLDSITNQQNQLQVQLQNRTDVISTIMGLKKEDYANSVATYDKEYAKNINLYSTLSSTQNVAQDNARANLQVIQNQIAAGKLDYDALTPEQKTTIDSLETQAGLPKGFTQFLIANVKGDVISTSSRTDESGGTYFDVLTKDTNGNLKVNVIYRGKSSGGNNSETDIITNFNKKAAELILKMETDPTYTYDMVFKALKTEFGSQGISDNAIYGTLGEKK